MIDGGLITGYLTVAVARGARRVADRAVDGLLDRLANVVGQRLGYGVLDPLRERPGDAQAAAAAKNAIDSATYADPSFASEIQALVAELDRRGARQLVNQVYAETNVQSFGSGIAAGRDVYIQEGRDPDDLSWTPAWVKACIGLGGAVALAGMLIFFYTLFTDNPDVNDPNFGQMPSGIPIAFGVFFAGLIISAIGGFGRATSKPPRRF